MNVASEFGARIVRGTQKTLVRLVRALRAYSARPHLGTYDHDEKVAARIRDAHALSISGRYNYTTAYAIVVARAVARGESE